MSYLVTEQMGIVRAASGQWLLADAAWEQASEIARTLRAQLIPRPDVPTPPTIAALRGPGLARPNPGLSVGR
ncbi:MAG: hypothetical protein ACOYNI_02090 [Acidimicrobiia bacterium]